jgi:AcrR family transcriptional regulator
MEKIDRRIKRTQKLLQEALIAVTLEKGFDAVTVRDITDRADVGYATFYRHYPDKETLLADVLETMSKEFQVLLAPASMITDPEKIGVLLFEFVYENADLCRVLFNSTNTMVLLQPVQEIGLQEMTTLFKGQTDGSIPMDLAASHLITSLVMMIRWWLDQGTPYSPEKMGKIAAQLIIQPMIESLQSR